MRAVPLLVHGRVAQAEVGAQVDDPHARSTSSATTSARGAVRIGDDGRVDVAVAVEVELLEHERHAVMRVEVVEPAAHVRARGDRAQLERGWRSSSRALSAPA